MTRLSMYYGSYVSGSLTAIFSGMQQGTVDFLELATLLVATDSVA